MIGFLLLTSLTVSIDSFVCGYSLSFKEEKKYPIVIIIALTVLVMCEITNYCACYLADILTDKTSIIGGAILILVGLFNLIKKDNSNSLKSRFNFLKCITVGFAVGLDGACANLSLAIMGINAFYVPIVIATMHALMISLGIFLANSKISKYFSKFSFLSPIILILLGAYKIVSSFL